MGPIQVFNVAWRFAAHFFVFISVWDRQTRETCGMLCQRTVVSFVASALETQWFLPWLVARGCGFLCCGRNIVPAHGCDLKHLPHAASSAHWHKNPRLEKLKDNFWNDVLKFNEKWWQINQQMHDFSQWLLTWRNSVEKLTQGIELFVLPRRWFA